MASPVGFDSLRISSSAGNDIRNFSKARLPPIDQAQSFVDVLNTLNVIGPTDVADTLTSRNKIGQGRQFSVHTVEVLGWGLRRDGSGIGHDCHILYQVAAKKCIIDLRPNERTEMDSTLARDPLRATSLEVLALQERRLKWHRNTVDLLGWARGRAYNNLPLLILELARGSLNDFVKTSGMTCQQSKHYFCLDISNGLDAIHDCGIVHGDVKPDNILVFENPRNLAIPFVAKLADFGFSENEARNIQIRILVCGGTRQWSALKIRDFAIRSVRLGYADYCKVDNHSFGLVLWSLTCTDLRQHGLDLNEAAVRMRSSVPDIAICQAKKTPHISRTIGKLLKTALSRLLVSDVGARSLFIAQLFHDESAASRAW